MKSVFGQLHRDRETLAEAERAEVVHVEDDIICLEQYGPWTPAMTKLAKLHRINALEIRETHKQEWPTLDFLGDLPPLRRLHVILSRPADLSPIAAQTDLESLGVMGNVEREDRTTPTVDFAPLKKVRQAYLELAAPTMSILQCSSLRHLWIWNDCKPWLKAIDLSRLTKLRELHVTAWAKLTALDLSAQAELESLHLEAIGKLKSVALHPDAKVTALKLGGCGPFRIDWDRMGGDLHELELSGPLRFPFEEVLKAPELRNLQTNGIRTFPPLKFLLKLPHLERFGYFTTPPGPKFIEEDWEIVRTINARHRRN